MKSNIVVLQTDFGLQDGAVAAMYGVALSVSNEVRVFNLSHDIEPYKIWDASYRLVQTLQYWPKGTVFVSVVDPGVGTHRASVVAKTTSGHYIVTPDNGTLTHIADNIGIEAIRAIDERQNRLPFSNESYTFHGRDIYAYTGARLAAGVIEFEDVGPSIENNTYISLPMKAVVHTSDSVEGMIDILDIRFGNLWTNIRKKDFDTLGITYNDVLLMTIMHENRVVYHNNSMFVTSFAEVNVGESLIYINSLHNIGVAINQGSFARAHQIGTGDKWIIRYTKKTKEL